MEGKGDKGTASAAACATTEVVGSRQEEGNTTMRTAETLLRLLPVSLCVSALMVMLKDSEANDFGSIAYSDFGGFRYLVHANGICAGYSLLSAIVTAMPRPFTMSRAWTFFFLDQVLTYLVLAAGAGSVEVLYLAYKGDSTITWSSACGSYQGFCHKATSAVVITFAIVACYTVLSLISSYKLFSKYDVPVGYPDKGIEIGGFQG